MPADKRHEEDGFASRAKEVFERQVRPKLRPEDHGKFVVLDIDTGDYEVDESDLAAFRRLRTRRPNAQAWLERAGYRAAHWVRRGR